MFNVLIRNNEQFDQILHHITFFNVILNIYLKKWNKQM